MFAPMQRIKRIANIRN